MLNKIGIILLLSLFSVPVLAQGQDAYGDAKFYRNDCWSRDGLKAHWVLDPGTEGDLLINASGLNNSVGNDGDFEDWNGTMGANPCTDCPSGWICNCAMNDINQESTYIFRNNSSVALESNAAGQTYISRQHDYDANVAYQVSFWYRGELGTEDFIIVATDAGNTDTYNFATDTWTAPLTYASFTNAPTAWTRGVLYINTGVVAKAGYYFSMASFWAGAGTLYFDDVQIQKLKSPFITGSMGNVLSVPATSDPLWGHSEKLLPRVGTGPAGWWGSWFDGVNDYFSCADADCEMDPILWENRGFFSVGCRLMTDVVDAAMPGIINKYGGASQRSWLLARSNNVLHFYVSDDGTNTAINFVAMFIVDTLHNFVTTFDPSGGPGACESNIYYNAYQINCNATMGECGPFNTPVELRIGSLKWEPYWSGSILECSLWGKELTAIESNKYISPYFPATSHGDGFYVDTCSQAASHATCSTQVCRDGTPNACQAEGSGIEMLYEGFTEQLDNNSYEAVVGDPSAGDFSDWIEGGFITAYLADSKHGNVSARMKGGSLTGECIIGGGADTYFEISAKSLEEGGTLEVWLREYDTGFCTNQLAITTIITCTPGSVYDDCGALFEVATWHADTSSYKIQIIDSVNGDMLVDAVSIKEASHRTPWVHCPTGSGTVSYTNRQYILDSPLARYVESEDGYAYASGFCGAAWIYSDWAGDDGVTHQIMTSPGTVGINNRWIVNKPNSNNIQFVLYDAVGALRQYTLIATSTNWSAGGWKFLEWCSSNTDNVLKGRHYNVNNKVWYNWTSAAGVGTGIQDGQSTDLHIGHDANINYLNGGASEIHLSPYSDIWPQKGFNSGKPPINHSPY